MSFFFHSIRFTKKKKQKLTNYIINDVSYSIYPSINPSMYMLYLSLLGDLSCNSGHIVYRLKRRETLLLQFDACFWSLHFPIFFPLSFDLVAIRQWPGPYYSPDSFRCVPDHHKEYMCLSNNKLLNKLSSAINDDHFN